MVKFTVIILFLFLIFTRPINAESIYSDECTSVSGWSEVAAFSPNATYTAVTYDTRSALRLTTDTADSSGRNCGIDRDVGTFSDDGKFWVNIVLNCDLIGTLADIDRFQIGLAGATYRLSIVFASDGLFVHDGSSWNEVGTNEVSLDVWQEWDFFVDFTSATVDIYRNSTLVASDIDCSNPSGVYANGNLILYQYGQTTPYQQTYVDSIHIGKYNSLSGVLKEKTSDVSGAAYNLLLLDFTNREVYAFVTADSNGDYEIDVKNTTDGYCGIIVDNIGGAAYDGNWGTTTTDSSGDWSITDAGWASGETVWAFFVDPDKTLKTVAFEFVANGSNTVADTHYLDIAHTTPAEDFVVYATGFGTATGYEPPNPIYDFATGN